MALPRTAKEAIKQGLQQVIVNFQNMTPQERKQWIRLNSPKKAGSLGLIRVFPGTNNGKIIVCFYDPNVGAFTNCFEMQASEIGLG